MKRNSAYTLIELLIGITIISIIFSVGFASYRDFSRREALSGVTKKVISDLRLIQQKALSGEKPVGCTTLNGFRFNIISTSQYKLEARCNVNTTVLIKKVDLSDEDVTIGASVEPILFKVLGQGTNLSSLGSTITLTNTKISKSSIVTIGIGGDVK